MSPATTAATAFDDLPNACQRVAGAARAKGLDIAVHVLSQSSRTAEEAAQACGTTVGRIVKSLVFEDAETGDPLMFLVSGTNRLNEKTVRAHTGRKVKRADADAVRKVTGFAIGGIPPFGHDTALATWMDRDLMDHEVIWAAAGTPNAVFPTTPGQLAQASGATVIDLK